MSEAVVIAIIGLFSGGLATALLKILEKFLGKAKEKAEADSGIRSELRLELDRKLEEVKALKDEMKVLEDAADKWRFDYWALFEVFYQLKMISQQIADPVLKQKIEAILATHEPKKKDAT
ncbi:hypothetical protein SEA_NICEHOUSE_221 [Rhodococcus phage NiceHouse]|nr:hypothetical protein SEA_NICEHOUSE_221 [Rhodococcus phage NiceHouse]